MRPHQKPSSAHGVARARLLMRRDLGWMTGFPDADGRWVSVPGHDPVEVRTIERCDLSRATHTITKLVNRFPRAMPKVVGDIETWESLHRSLLEVLKRHVHRGEPFPGSAIEAHPPGFAASRTAVEAAISRSPGLRGVIERLTWLCWLEPDRFGSAVGWLEAHREAWAGTVRNLGLRDGVVALLQLTRLRERHGDRRVEPLLIWLAPTESFEFPTGEGAAFASEVATGLRRLHGPQRPKQRARCEAATASRSVPARRELHAVSWSVPARPEAQLGRETVSWVHWLCAQDSRTARRGLELYAAVVAPEAPGRWGAWWRDVQAAAEQAFEAMVRGHALARRAPERSDDLLAKAMVLVERIEKRGEKEPPILAARACFQALRRAAVRMSGEQCAVVVSALGVVPMVHQGRYPRPALLSHWNQLQRTHPSDRQKQVFRLIATFRDYLADHDDRARALEPWQGVSSGEPVWIDDHLIERLVRPAHVKQFFVTLRELQKQGEDVPAVHDLVALMLASGSSERAVCLYPALRRLKQHTSVPEIVVVTILEMIGGRDDQFEPATRAVLKVGERSEELETVGRQLRALHRAQSRSGFLLEALLCGQGRSVITAAYQAAVVRSIGDRVPRPRQESATETPAWAERFSAELHPALRRLAAAAPNAPSLALRTLGKDFPDPAALRREIRALEARIQTAGLDDSLDARLARLRSRLESPRAPSEHRLANLASKLDEAAVRAACRTWCARVRDAYVGCLPRILCTDALPDWGGDERILQLLLHVQELKPASRRLAYQLLHGRCGPAPWDLRDAAGNRRFLEGLGRLGVDARPWVDGSLELVRDCGGTLVRFALERDPLEVLFMGAYFDTCLSPDRFNFFSAITNAADINKQVLYGREADGTVFARCLLALTDEGGIVTFRPYCHDKQFDFGSVAAEFAGELARRMRTTVLGRGEIRTLVASDWYDDGSVELSGLTPLVDAHELCARLHDAPLQAVIGTLRAAVDPLPLNELTLPAIIGLQVLDARPELTVPLYPIVVGIGRLPLETQIRFVQLLVAAGRERDAELLGPRLVQVVATARPRQCSCCECLEPVLQVLIRVSPRNALVLLRKTRDGNVRTWSQESDPQRLMYGGRANERLYRAKRAAELYALALERCGRWSMGGVKEFCEERLAELRS